MAISSGFFNSVEGDRKYSANDFGDIFNGIIRDGVFDNVGKMMMVKPGTGVQVVVQPGRAWFNGTWTFIDADTPVNLGAADPTRDRIDAIVLKIDKTVDVRANSLEVIAGSPASSPSKPSIPSSTDVWRYALAFVTVKAAGTSISAENIENCVGTSTCPLVTGALQLADITTIYQGMKEQFDTWFANLKHTLSDDVAGNLQNEIEERVKYTDKATAEDVSNATPSKWIDAEMVNSDAFKKAVEPALPNYYQVYTSSTTWTAPKDGYVLVFGCGGGGGGGGSASGTQPRTGYGGEDGWWGFFFLKVKKGDKHTITIGSGGSGGVYGSTGTNGSTGGTTSFGNVEVFAGGSGGKGGQPSYASSAEGWQVAMPTHNRLPGGGVPLPKTNYTDDDITDFKAGFGLGGYGGVYFSGKDHNGQKGGPGIIVISHVN